MESKTKKTSAIAMIIGGLIVFSNSLLAEHTEKTHTNHLIIMVCSAIFVVLGVISLTKISREIKNEK